MQNKSTTCNFYFWQKTTGVNKNGPGYQLGAINTIQQHNTANYFLALLLI